jgi:hypothetical protein
MPPQPTPPTAHRAPAPKTAFITGASSGIGPLSSAFSHSLDFLSYQDLRSANISIF